MPQTTVDLRFETRDSPGENFPPRAKKRKTSVQTDQEAKYFHG